LGKNSANSKKDVNNKNKLPKIRNHKLQSKKVILMNKSLKVISIIKILNT
jgi:hypothetical protein